MTGAGTEAAVRFEGVTKRFSRRTVLQDISFDVPAGEIFGFLGPNGAGKSTTIRMILGLTSPTKGTIKLFGNDLSKDRTGALAGIGAMVDGPALHDHLTARENLRVFGKLTASGDRAHVDELLGHVGLSDRGDDKVRTFSYGMRVRLGLALALLRKPRLIVLDEPTDGLDPHGVMAVRELLRDLKRAGVTVFLSSHLLGEIEAVCDRVAILVRGELRACGSIEELTRGSTLEQRFVELTSDESRRDRLEPIDATPAAKAPLGSLKRAFLSECIKLRSSNTNLFLLLLMMVVSVLGALRLGGPSAGFDVIAKNGFTDLGHSMQTVSVVLAVFALLMGAASVAGESNDGTLRSSLAAPVDKGSFLLGKIAALCTWILILNVAALTCSSITALFQGGFESPLTAEELKDIPKVEAFGTEALVASTFVACVSSLLATVCAVSLAVTISIFCRKSAEAIIWSGLTFVVFYALGTFLEFAPERAFLFTAYLDGPWEHLLQLGEKRTGYDWFWGNSDVPGYTGDVILDRRRASYLAIAVPGLQAALLCTAAWLLFLKRDVRA